MRSYGKVVYVFSVVPVFGMLVLCTKMLGLMPRDAHHQVFPETEWTEFFINSNVSKDDCEFQAASEWNRVDWETNFYLQEVVFLYRLL